MCEWHSRAQEGNAEQAGHYCLPKLELTVAIYPP